MRRLISLFGLFIVAIATIASDALAQATAGQGYQEAKGAYEAGSFAEARDLARKASQTDPKNAEVFLMLGQAHYQLGELDEAIAAWKRTLALAPEEPFAKRMLSVLRREQTDVDTRIALVEAMVRERLYSPAREECGRVLGNKALSGAQRVKVMTLQAEIAVRMGKHPEALETLRELLVLYPNRTDPVQTTLLLGQAKLHAGGEATAEGLALLKRLVAEHADTPPAATAQYELFVFDLQQGATPARVDALAQWVAAHGDHQKADDARRTLLGGYLSLTRLGAKPAPDADLSPSDVKALALAAELLKETTRAGDAKKLTEQLLAHIDAHYAKNGANAAAVEGAKTLLAAPLAPTSRLPVLKAQARYKTAIAIGQLDDQARAGRLPQGVPRAKLPPALAEVVAVYNTINQEYPSQPAWTELAQLAVQVRAFGPKVLALAEFHGLKGPDAWALDIAMPIVKANADPAAVKTAVDTVRAIIHERTQVPKPGSQKLAVDLSAELVEALSPLHPAWSEAMKGHAALLDARARALFDENLKAGRGGQNAKPSDLQTQLLATLQKHVAREAAHAPAALSQLAAHLKPWIEHGHWAVAEEAYTSLAKSLPETERRQADLAVVALWIQEVTREHQRLASTGLTVPRKLDPRMAKALARCYALQAGLDEEPKLLAQVRSVWDSIVTHYKSLEYYDVAEAAVQVKSEPAVELADEYAAFASVQLKDEAARRQLARFLKQYGAREKIELSKAFQDVIAAWKKLIADRPSGSLASQAVDRIFAIGRLFEQQAAHEVASGIYQDLAKFAATVDVLSVAAPGTPSTAQRAAYAAAAALDAHARKLLAEQREERKTNDPPPEELSEQFAAAIAAYDGFLQTHPDSPLAREAIGRIMAVALEYAKVDAWDVAHGVYAKLLESKLSIRRPERLEFCQALCRLGHAMPDHAREMLSTLTEAGLRESGPRPAETMLAGEPAGPRAGRRRGRTRGGMGGGVGGAGMAGMPGAPTQPAPSAEAPDPVAATPAPADQLQTLADVPARRREQADRDVQLLAMIRNQEANRATHVAQLRENAMGYGGVAAVNRRQEGQQAAQQQEVPVPVLSETELARQEKSLTAAYDGFQSIRTKYRETPTAEQARGEILVMVSHWRSVGQWQRAADLAKRFLGDNPADVDKPKIRLEIARDWLAWASMPIPRKPTRQAMLGEVSTRFTRAREELAGIVSEFPKERKLRQQAQWDAAGSFLTQARAVNAFSPTLARGQYVRAAKELQEVAVDQPDHPQIGTIPKILWDISQELESRSYFEESILVWNDLTIRYPMDALAQQAALKIAQTYQQRLQRPLRAAEAYQELNFARGGSDQNLQNAILQIGTQLKDQKRWVEALHVLEMFVDGFPRHPQAGQALTMIGQIHQTNEAWEDAITAFRRVIDEFTDGQWVKEAKWAIAECTINLSQWNEAAAAYRAYVEAYPKEAEKTAEANRRIDVLKDLARYQALVDEEGQRKAFDAQFQIASIVASRLSNRVKAIIEYRKVVSNWSKSHLADDALYEVGAAYLDLGETQKAREALLAVAEKYPASPLADDAVFLVGKSYEDEADRLATVTRAQSIQKAKEVAQRYAYEQVQLGRRKQEEVRGKRIAALKKAGKADLAEAEEAFQAANTALVNEANVKLFVQKAGQDVETFTATQLADRQDKINAALRKAVDAYTKASEVAGADKADEALLQMATIYDRRLKDSEAAMATWLEIVRQFSGTAVAEDASWRIAQTYERRQDHAEAAKAYEAFLRNYRRSPNAGQAQFAIAENYEHLGEWIKAMDSYTNYLNNFPEGPLVQKAKEQINWIKTYRL